MVPTLDGSVISALKLVFLFRSIHQHQKELKVSDVQRCSYAAPLEHLFAVFETAQPGTDAPSAVVAMAPLLADAQTSQVCY